MGYLIVDSLRNGDSLLVGQVVDSWAPMYKNGSVSGYVYAPLLKNAPKVLPNSTTSTYSPKVTPTGSSVSHYTIKGTDNGYHWNNTVDEAKLAICKDLAKRIGRRDAQFYYEALEDFYDTADPVNLKMRLQLTVAEVAGLCSVM